MRPLRHLLASLLRTASALGVAVAIALLATPALVTGGRLFAQEAAAEKQVDYITPHITDSYELEYPWFNSHFAREACLGHREPNGHCGPARWVM